MKVKYSIAVFCMLPLLTACNQNDNTKTSSTMTTNDVSVAVPPVTTSTNLPAVPHTNTPAPK